MDAGVEVGGGEDRVHALEGQRRRGVDAADASAGERAPHEAGVEHPGPHDVVDEGAVAGQQPRVLHPVHAAARVRSEPRPAPSDVGRQPTLAVVPPSIEMTAPVMKLARSDARNEASSATSSGWPARLSADASMSCGNRAPEPGPAGQRGLDEAGAHGVGADALVPYSTAADLVNEMTPAFEAL